MVTVAGHKHSNFMIQVKDFNSGDSTKANDVRLYLSATDRNPHARVWFTKKTPPLIVAENGDRLTNADLVFLDRQR